MQENCMRKTILIAVGGGAGAILRYLTGGMLAGSADFPLGTLTVNLLGCFLLSLLLTEAFELLDMNMDLRLGIATGFLGAFTTFSAFCRETAGMISASPLSAALYIVSSALLGFGATFLGFMAARNLAAARAKDKIDHSGGF